MKHALLTLLSVVFALTTLHSQSEYCLEGTVWDDAQGGCVPEDTVCGVISDLDSDGGVGTGDLLFLLSQFGDTFPDDDADGICDDLDPCIGEYDACGVCNGPGEIYECGCADIPVGDCDCNGNQIGTNSCFSCGDEWSHQGYSYSTVQIGDQCWFAENLRTENYGNGEAIPSSLSDSEWAITISGAVATYGEGDSYCESVSPDGNPCDETWSLIEYGRLYNWYAVNDSRGLCPSTWHVPTDEEWTVLTDELGGESSAGDSMKTNYGWVNNNNGTNSSGFSGLPGAGRESTGEFLYAGVYGFWWSSSFNGNNAWYRSLSPEASVYRHYWNWQDGMSVRCVRDAE